MSKQIRLFHFFILCTLILLNTIFHYSSDYNENFNYEIFYFYNLLSVLIFLYFFYFIIKIGGLFSIHSITTFFTFLFLYGRSLLYIFETNESFFETDSMIYEYLGTSNIFTALIVVNVFTYAVTAVYILFGKPDKVRLISTPKSVKIESFLFYSLLFIGILYSIKLFIEIKAIVSLGYISIYAGGLKEINYYNPIIKFSNILFLSCFSYYLLVIKSKKKFLIIGTLFLLLSLLDSLKGARVTFILPIFYIIWYYNSVFKINIDFKIFFKFFVVLLLIATFSIYTSLKRNDLEIDLKTNLFKSAITETGSTLQFVGRYVKNKDQLISSYPFFIEPIIYPYYYFRYFDIYTNGQSEEMLKYRNSLNHQFSAFISREAYVSGRGLGSSSPAEFYQYGLIPLIFISFIYGFILITFYDLLDKKFILFISTSLVPQLFFISRDSPFPNFLLFIKGIFVFYLLKIFFLILFKNKYFPLNQNL